ncbi:hypothetical protein C8Q76DRAFT_821414 [Earliella scabrosa]|nr:hypothetical protein C8Q76DRAFT_821414 [Earliella scabrosa]
MRRPALAGPALATACPCYLLSHCWLYKFIMLPSTLLSGSPVVPTTSSTAHTAVHHFDPGQATAHTLSTSTLTTLSRFGSVFSPDQCNTSLLLTILGFIPQSTLTSNGRRASGVERALATDNGAGGWGQGTYLISALDIDCLVWIEQYMIYLYHLSDLSSMWPEGTRNHLAAPHALSSRTPLASSCTVTPQYLAAILARRPRTDVGYSLLSVIVQPRPHLASRAPNAVTICLSLYIWCLFHSGERVITHHFLPHYEYKLDSASKCIAHYQCKYSLPPLNGSPPQQTIKICDLERDNNVTGASRYRLKASRKGYKVLALARRLKPVLFPTPAKRLPYKTGSLRSSDSNGPRHAVEVYTIEPYETREQSSTTVTEKAITPTRNGANKRPYPCKTHTHFHGSGFVMDMGLGHGPDICGYTHANAYPQHKPMSVSLVMTLHIFNVISVQFILNFNLYNGGPC